MRLSSNLRAVDIHACREATGVQGVLLLLLLSLHVVDADPLSVLEQEHRHLDHKMVHMLFSAKGLRMYVGWTVDTFLGPDVARFLAESPSNSRLLPPVTSSTLAKKYLELV